jgi:membrane protein YdbS with pleckstrin-like domain
MRRAEIATAGIVGVVAAVLTGLAAGTLAGVVVGAGVLLAVAVGERVARNRYRSWGYCERSRDLLVKRGVLFRRLTVVPYGRMQLIDVKAGLVERLFHLSTVALHTAAATSDARIPGLAPDEAARLRDRLAALGESQAAGV